MGNSGIEAGFQGLHPALLAILLAVSVLVLLRYRRFLHEVDFSSPWLPLLLRGAALAMALLLAAGPVVYFKEKTPVFRAVSIVVDSSQSMSVKDGMEKSRWERATDAAEKLAGKLGPESRVYTFSGDAGELAAPEELNGRAPSGARTEISRAIQEVSTPGEGGPSDIVIFTDGMDTEGLSARSVTSAGPRIHAVGVGPAKPFQNVGIFSFRVPEYGFVEKELGVDGEIYMENVPGGVPVGIELYENGDRVGHQTIESAGIELRRYGFSMSFMPEKPGVRTLEIRVKAESEGPVRIDNTRTAFCDVISGRRAVLYVGAPGWEHKFLHDFLSGMEKLALDVVLLGPGRTYRGADERKTLSNSGLLVKYRLVIIGDAGSLLSADERKALLEYVRGGGQAVILGGGRSLLGTGGGWAEALGVQARGIQGDMDGFELTPTERGLASNLLRLVPGQGENAGVWKRLPFVQTYYRTSPPGGAEILATHPWVNCGGGLCPMIYLVPTGGGGALVFAFHGLWRWKFVEKRPELYDVLWENVLREFLEKEQQRAVTVALSDNEIEMGEKIEAAVRVQQGVLSGGEAPELMVQGPGGGDPEAVPLEPVEEEKGLFTATYIPGRTGAYEFTAKAGSEKSGVEHLAVNVSAVEFTRAGLDEDLLRKLAGETGGAYYHENEADGLAGNVLKNVDYRQVRKAFRPWSSVVFLLVLAGLLTAEWIVRRRGGLT